MPTYEYKCITCGTTMDMQVPAEDRDNPWECHCGDPMKRTYSAPAIKFNGTGFYSTGG
jgi:putative FmdB family regulatory protein